MHFEEEQTDINVLEVGLGGRLDATNVVTPAVSVMTSISLDHVPILGTTIPEIAAEKGGIIKPGVPVVVAPQELDALAVFERMAADNGAPLTLIGRDVIVAAGEHSLEGQFLSVGRTGGLSSDLFIPLLGRHQIDNAATAWAALQVLRRQGISVPPSAIVTGFAGVRWPGRFEFLRHRPYIILDAAHNADSAQKLVETVQTYFPNRKIDVIFGASGDKAVESFLRTLKPIVRRLVVTRSSHPRAMSPDILLHLAESIGLPAEAADTIEIALNACLPDIDSDDALLVTGSVFVVGAARDAWSDFRHGL